jgi:hypothetical protein
MFLVCILWQSGTETEEANGRHNLAMVHAEDCEEGECCTYKQTVAA